MLNIPINATNFKEDFLGGAGQFNITTPNAFDLNEPLPKTITTLTTAGVATPAAPNVQPSLQFGQAQGLACTVSFQGQAQGGSSWYGLPVRMPSPRSIRCRTSRRARSEPTCS